MQQAAGHPQYDPFRPTRRTAQQGQPKSHQDNPDVLDTVIGQQSFQVMLTNRKHNPQQPADGTQQQNQAAP